MKVCIDGIGVVGGFGCGVSALHKALLRADVGVGFVSDAPHSGEGSSPVYLANTAGLDNYIPKKALRRVDHFSKLALLGACLALDDAGQLTTPKERLGLIVATGYGPAKTTFAFLDSVILDGDSLASPTHFSSSVHNAAAAHLSILLKVTGPSLTVSQFEMSFVSALLAARQWLEEGRVDAVLLGAVDEYCQVLGYCWQRFNGKNPGKRMRPLDFSAQTAIPGEGAVFFYLSKDECGPSSGRYARVREASMGRISDASLVIPTDTPTIIGADGHRQCGKAYDRIFAKEHTVAAYAALFGSLPVGQGFDVAVAALTLQKNTLFQQPDKHPDQTTFRLITQHAQCPWGAIRCFKFGADREFGMIALEL